MNIVYLLGNGFDLAQGLRTRYIDFYPAYVGRTAFKTPAIEKVCRTIESDYKTWADMEIALGKYTTSINIEDFEDIYYDICDNLRLYLLKEQASLKFTQENVDKLKSDFLAPQNFLYGRDRDSISDLLQGEKDYHHINIISFNYTSLVEDIFPEISFAGKILGKNTYVDGIYHIHGMLDKTMIMGVNDVSQIDNKDFINNQDTMDILVKPLANDAIRSSESVISSKLIKGADIIVLKGLSLGDTDKIWWQEIVNGMYYNRKKYLVIYWYDTEVLDFLHAHKLGSKIRKVREYFISKTDFTKDKAKSIEDRILVSFQNQYLSTTF